MRIRRALEKAKKTFRQQQLLDRAAGRSPEAKVWDQTPVEPESMFVEERTTAPYQHNDVSLRSTSTAGRAVAAVILLGMLGCGVYACNTVSSAPKPVAEAAPVAEQPHELQVLTPAQLASWAALQPEISSVEDRMTTFSDDWAAVGIAVKDGSCGIGCVQSHVNAAQQLVFDATRVSNKMAFLSGSVRTRLTRWRSHTTDPVTLATIDQKLTRCTAMDQNVREFRVKVGDMQQMVTSLQHVTNAVNNGVYGTPPLNTGPGPLQPPLGPSDVDIPTACHQGCPGDDAVVTKPSYRPEYKRPVKPLNAPQLENEGGVQ